MATFLDPENGYLGALTFDLGSDLIRAGFAGDDMPRALYPSTACFAGSEGNDEPLVLTDGDTHPHPEGYALFWKEIDHAIASAVPPMWEGGAHV